MADFYIQGVGTFLRDKLASRRGILALPNDAVHIGIDVPSEFARTVRQAARDWRFSANGLIYTAVHQLYEPSERAA